MLHGIDAVHDVGGRLRPMSSDGLTLDLEDIIHPFSPSPVSASQSAVLPSSPLPLPVIAASDHSHNTNHDPDALSPHQRSQSPEPLNHVQIKNMHLRLQQLGLLTSGSPSLGSEVSARERELVDMVRQNRFIFFHPVS